MAATKAAEEGIKHCHRCGKEFRKESVRIPTPKKENRLHGWYLCLTCFHEEGGAWWANNKKKKGELIGIQNT